MSAAAVADHLAIAVENLAQMVGASVAEALPSNGDVHAPELVLAPGGTGTSDAVYHVSGERAMWPLSVMCRLVTSAAVADRTVALEYRDPDGERFLVAGTQAVVQASNTQSFCWHPQAGEVAWPIEDAAIAPLPQQHLGPNYQMALKVGNGDAGDVIDNVRIMARFDPVGVAG